MYSSVAPIWKDREWLYVGCVGFLRKSIFTTPQFHSDAEVGLGPLVAGLSLGSPALMHFRLHARHDPLYERRGILLTIVLRHVSKFNLS